jgi:hypothetical protein
MPEARWGSVSEFLSDLPRFHCLVKPPHNFCTVCLRINSTVASDCPLRHEQFDQPRARAAAPPRAQGDFLPQAPPEVEAAEHDAMVDEHVPAAAVMPDAPVIEFARSTEPARKRVKARAVQKRSAQERGEGADVARRHEPDERVWATHEGRPAPPDSDERDLRDWDPETQGAAAGHKPPRPPRPPSDA